METPQAMWMRIAMGLALNEKAEERQEYAIKFYETLSQFDVVSSTPTLFNSEQLIVNLVVVILIPLMILLTEFLMAFGKKQEKVNLPVVLDLILPISVQEEVISKEQTESTKVYFWKLYNDMLVAVNQGGKRKGAGCAYLETWHATLKTFWH